MALTGDSHTLLLLANSDWPQSNVATSNFEFVPFVEYKEIEQYLFDCFSRFRRPLYWHKQAPYFPTCDKRHF